MKIRSFRKLYRYAIVKLFMRLAFFGACMAIVLPTLAPARADDGQSLHGFAAGDTIVRARITSVVPVDVHSKISVIGGKVDVPTMIMPDVDVSYFLNEHWSVTGQTGLINTRVKIKNSAYGNINVGTVWTVPLSLAVQYHLLPGERLRPYVGAGLLANWYFGEKPAGGFVRNFKVSPTYAPVIKAGLDYQINDRWFANAEIKGIIVPNQTIENAGVRATTNATMVTVGLGVGYRF